eukprot:3662198-Amphidinium_carterae.3
MSALGWKPHGLTEWQDDRNFHWNLDAVSPKVFAHEIRASWQRITCHQVSVNRSDFQSLTPIPRKLVQQALQRLDTVTRGQILHSHRGVPTADMPWPHDVRTAVKQCQWLTGFWKELNLRKQKWLTLRATLDLDAFPAAASEAPPRRPRAKPASALSSNIAEHSADYVHPGAHVRAHVWVPYKECRATRVRCSVCLIDSALVQQSRRDAE